MLRLESEIRELDRLFASVKAINEDDEMKSHLVKYLCIRSSGLMENAVKELVEEFHTNTCKRETLTYVMNKIDKVTSLDDDNLKKLLHAFNKKWAEEYDQTRSNNLETSLDSIIHNRHSIAHGKARSVGLTFRAMEQYFNDLKQLLDILKDILKK